MSFKILRVVFPLLMFAAATIITTMVIQQPVQTNSKAFEKKAASTPTVKTTPPLRQSSSEASKPSPKGLQPSATPSAETPSWETLGDVNGDGVVNTLDYSTRNGNE